MLITALLLGLLALTGDAAVTANGINPVQHSEAKGINPVQHSEAAETPTTNATKPPNPVQHSE